MIKTTKGFTLAEVLTTLMVIGVVAAMTIPTLMNGTAEQQARVAYRKAMSVLGQGIQLMIAKEDECTVTNSHQLAACMSKVISGTLYDMGDDATDVRPVADSTNGNVIVTADGMSYAFFYQGPDENWEKSLADICGNSFSSANPGGFDGSTANCIVVVDTNGVSKGAKAFTDMGLAAGAANARRALTGDDIHGSEQVPIQLTGAGVRPMYVANDKKISTGYQYMYGAGVPDDIGDWVSPFTGDNANPAS